MNRQVTFQGTPLALVGRVITPGMQAPDFTVTTMDLKEQRLGDFGAKTLVISTFPSLDTPVCDLQVKEFNRRAAALSGEVVVVGISKDLPFAQKRFCQESKIVNEVVLSDYKTGSFGINYGLLIKELNLLARAALIIDQKGTLRYLQVAPELTRPLDYDAVINRLSEVLKAPASVPQGELPQHCTPCEGGVASLPREKIEKLLAQHRGWQLVEERKIVKELTFKDFVEATYFVDLLAVMAQEQGHHPTITIAYNKVKITLTTHAAGGLTDNDFIMARIIDQLGAGE